jgi:hypothetical protein
MLGNELCTLRFHHVFIITHTISIAMVKAH